MNTNTASARILAIDDEPFDLMLMDRYLSRAGFEVARAVNGAQAWRILHEPGHELPQAILLDRMMPEMDGIKFLALLGADPVLSDIPVIMQTGLAEPDQIAHGISCGARYYLAKPFSGELLVAIVRSAVNDYRQGTALREAASRFSLGSRLLRNARFELHTLDEANVLAPHLAQYFPFPQRVALGIAEMLINAIEHGNLAVNYADKSELMKNGIWETEVRRRIELPEYRNKRVAIELRILPDRTVLHIADEGEGFDWLPFLEIQPERVFDLHGRGIAMSRLMSFDNIQYLGCGNEVQVTVMAPVATGSAAGHADAVRNAA
jgi:CheY-like chemotaxis protein